MTLAPPQEPPPRNVLPFDRWRAPPAVRDKVLSRWARHIILCVEDAFPQGTVRALRAARPQDCFDIIDAALDACQGTPYLSIPSIGADLESEFLLPNGGIYEVISFRIAPTHAHVLIQEADAFSLDATVKRWKEGAICSRNVRRGHDEQIWAPGYYDTIIGHVCEIEAVRRAIVDHQGRSQSAC